MTCAYDAAQTITVSKADSDIGEINLPAGDKSHDDTSVEYDYTGEAGTIVLKYAATAYIHKIVVGYTN